MAWVRGERKNDGWVNDIWYAVRDSNGAEVRSPTKLTADTPGYSDDYYGPTLVGLTNGQVALAFQRAGDYGDIYLAVLNSSGDVLRAPANLSNDGRGYWDWGPDSVELSDGKIVVAWTGNNRTRFAVLDGAYNRIAGPTSLNNAPAVTGDAYVSVTADAAGHAILTWTDYDYDHRHNLYYALVNGSGAILTPATIFRTSEATVPFIETSYAGYGNAPYNYAPNVTVTIDSPSPGGVIANGSLLSGWAVDMNSLAGTGIDAIHLYLDGPYGTGTFAGAAQYGLNRPDVGAYLGDGRFTPSGWQLTWGLAASPGPHELYLYARRSMDGNWTVMPPHAVWLQGGNRFVYLPLLRK